MKGILTTICALALLGSATTKTFPNDLYYSHHPDLAIADYSSSEYSRGRNSLYEGPQRNSYGEDSHTDYRERRPYRANYDGNEKKASLVYNQDGSINWAETKSKKHKVAEVDDKGYLKFPIDGSRDSNVGNEGNVNNRMSSTDSNNNNNDNQQNNNDQYESSYGNRNQGDYNQGSNQGSSQGNNNYDNNQGNNNYGNNQGSNNYGGNSQGGNNYGDNSQNSNNYDGNNQGSNNYGNNQGNNNYRTTQKYNAYRDDAKSSARFAGGMRLAGVEPEDGYFHGTGTFYDLETRTGTCGKQHKNMEMVAALNAEQMGDSNSSNENCGKEIEVVGPNGKTVTVTVVDSCKTCESGGLDLSPAAYEELGDFSHGSIPIKWKFI